MWQLLPGLGGAMDIAFLHYTAYVLVTLVGSDVGSSAIDGTYRVDGPHHATVLADIGAWPTAHPPCTAFDVPTGVQYAMQAYWGGFLVTDGHHNRVLQVTPGGRVCSSSPCPTSSRPGWRSGARRVMAEVGPAPHRPEDGKVVAFTTRSRTPGDRIRRTAPRRRGVRPRPPPIRLSQGHFPPGRQEGSPADPNTGALERVNPDGTMTPVATGLDRPSSLELIGNTALLVTLTGEIWTIHHVAGGSG